MQKSKTRRQPADLAIRKEKKIRKNNESHLYGSIIKEIYEQRKHNYMNHL